MNKLELLKSTLNILGVKYLLGADGGTVTVSERAIFYTHSLCTDVGGGDLTFFFIHGELVHCKGVPS